MNWAEMIHLPLALLGWLIFIVDQWDVAIKKHGDAFTFGLFISKNLPNFIMNLLCIVALGAIASNTGLQMSVAESIGAGYLGSQIFKNRFKRNGKV